MEEKKNEKKDKKKKWPPAHEVLTILLGDMTCIQTIARACAMGIAVPPKGIPGLINALELAKSTMIGKVGLVAKDISTGIRNLKRQLTEAEDKKKKVDKEKKLVFAMSDMVSDWMIASLKANPGEYVVVFGRMCLEVEFPPEKIPGMIEAFEWAAEQSLLRKDSNSAKDYNAAASNAIAALQKQLVKAEAKEKKGAKAQKKKRGN